MSEHVIQYHRINHHRSGNLRYPSREIFETCLFRSWGNLWSNVPKYCNLVTASVTDPGVRELRNQMGHRGEYKHAGTDRKTQIKNSTKLDIMTSISYIQGRDSSFGIATRYGLDGPGIKSRWGARISAPVKTGPGAHPSSCTVGTGSFPGVQRPGRGADPPPPS